MRIVFFIFNLFLWIPSANAQVWQDIFKCQSMVPGFESFQVQKTLESPEETLEFQVSTGSFLEPEIWSLRQMTGLHPEQHLQFEGLFARVGADPEGPLSEKEFLLYLTINRSGTGSLSVDGELDPLFCQPAF